MNPNVPYLSQRPEGEILGMGGPWIGQVYWQGQQLPGDYLVQAEVVDPEALCAVLVATNQRTATARGQVVFWLVVVALGDGALYRSRTCWPSLYAEEMAAGRIGFYPLFYAGQPSQKQYLAVDLARDFLLVD